MTSTILERALLGLVSLTPQSGYDVKRIFESSAMGQFSSSPGAIYPALRRLESQGLLTSESEHPGRVRARRVFSLTGEGETTLRAWLVQPVTVEELRRRPSEPLLRVTFAQGRLSREELLTYLDGFRRAVEAFVNELTAQRRQFADQGEALPAMALDHGIASYGATLDWIERTAALLADAADPLGLFAEPSTA